MMCKAVDKMSSKIPEIRFNGFTDDWEQRKLDLIFKKIRNAFVGTATPYYVEDGNFYLESNNVKDGSINRKTEIFINNDFYEKQKDKWLHTDDIVMVQSGHVGHTAVIPEELNNTAAHAVIMFQGYQQQTDPHFLNFQFQTGKAKKELSSITTGNTIKHILASEMKKFKVSVPQYEEQNKVGDFFKELDNAIALHQRELDNLIKSKKGFLQKMFPKKGKKVPELRFSEFTKDWEHRKLKQLGEIQTGNTPSTNNIKNYDDGGILWVTPTDIKSLTVINTAKKLSTEGAKKARIAKAGSILVTCIASIGKNTLATKDVGFNQQINSLTPFSENDSYFLLTQSKIWSEKMKQSAASGTMQIVNKSEFSNITTMIPEFKEQIKIGNFFKQIDNTIALHQKQLDNLKQTKKAFLQKMFV